MHLHSDQKGFTLIELIVVITVTVFIVGAAANIFLSMTLNQSRAVREQELFNQASYAVDYMARQIQGAVIDVSGSCLGGAFAGYNHRLTHFDGTNNFYQGIKFISQEGDCQEFFIDTDGLAKEKKGSTSAQQILSDVFEVEYLRFVINGDKSNEGSSGTDGTQPRITLVLDVKTKDEKSPQEKIIQTTVSQQRLNI